MQVQSTPRLPIWGVLAAAASESGRLAAAAAAAAELAAVQPALAAAVEEAQKTVNQWNSLYTLLQTLQEAERTVREQQAVAERLKAMLDIVEAERKGYVDQLVRAISNDVNALPYASTRRSRWAARRCMSKPNVTGSLELRGWIRRRGRRGARGVLQRGAPGYLRALRLSGPGQAGRQTGLHCRLGRRIDVGGRCAP